ncbi:hypothetical protein AJ78_08592 [Emergomyces pasteurianus Ep9510]|uniref:Uncharacterized protein n=1 Tax=Emergomyces pasteurianus Ep9510 TaxID=1447872 RepID=A0A1J9P3B9_9EURO|nr:hypothetical protein AJ78_08592 [Emergomyces pasteurianus Ep9510]
MSSQYQSKRAGSSQRNNMMGIPKIELCSPQESLPQCYATVSPCTLRAPLELSVSSLSLEQEKTINKSKSDNGLRKSFWSKLKRNKSENYRHSDMPSTYARSDPQQARASGRLIWSNEHHMWMFPDPKNSSEQHRWLARENERRPRSTIAITRTSNDSDELLFAQLPGHYPLSPYDSVNNNNALPTYTTGGNFDDVATRRGTESQWTLVAKRVSGSASAH